MSSNSHNAQISENSTIKGRTSPRWLLLVSLILVAIFAIFAKDIRPTDARMATSPAVPSEVLRRYAILRDTASISSENAYLESSMQHPNECCGKKPAFSDPAYSSVFTGRVAVTTSFAGQGTGYVLEVIDLKSQSTMPANTGPPTVSPAMYHGPAGAQWTKTKLGNVFGLTLDNQGNIYTTATTAYNGDFFPVSATGGEIYKINGVTGAITVFQTLPQKTLPAGLGNITYDCAYQRFYVSDMGNGIIYSLDTSGSIQSTWNHGANLSIPIPDNPSLTFTPLGRRVWGIQAYNGRLYYGVVWEDNTHISVLQNNEVWSVGLLANGNISGPAQKEISLPPRTGNETMPVSDISFGPAASGTMLIAERSMTDETTPNAHQSRILEYTLASGTWTLVNPNKYKFNPNYPQSSAGGVDYDFAVGGLVWSSGDALHYPTPPANPPETDMIYGIAGFDPTNGGDTHSAILIDEDGISNYYKTQLGDVEIPCPEQAQPQTCAVKTNDVSCKKDGSGGYLYTFTVTNNTGKPVTNVLITPPLNSNFSISPQSPALPGGILPNGQSTSLQVTITGGQPGKPVCFTVTLMTQDGPCCTVEVCPVLPNCCALAENASITCGPHGSYSYVLSVVNTSPNTIQHIYLYPPAGVTMTPSYFAVSLSPGATFQTPPITITGAHSGSFCFRLSLHTKGMEECCSGDQCVTLPDCHPSG